MINKDTNIEDEPVKPNKYNLDEESINNILSIIPEASKLNCNQINIIKYFLLGYSKRECYIKAYPDYNKSLTKSELSSRGGKILSNDNVKAVIEKVIEHSGNLILNNAIQDAIMSVTDRKIFLSNVTRGIIKNQIMDRRGNIIEISPSIEVRLKSLDLLNKMELLYQTEESEKDKDIIINVISDGTILKEELSNPNVKEPQSIDLKIEGIENDEDNISNNEIHDNKN